MTTSITGIVLAGGQARRMGGIDKGLVPFSGRPMIEHALERLEPQVDKIKINANRNQARYQTYGHTVFSDAIADYQGPLAGVSQALGQCDTDYILTAPCDSPLLPSDLAERLLQALLQENAALAVASVDGRWQPVFALIHRNLAKSLEAYLNAGERKIDRWMRQHPVAVVSFDDQAEAFINLNTLEELQHLEADLHQPPAT